MIIGYHLHVELEYDTDLPMSEIMGDRAISDSGVAKGRDVVTDWEFGISRCKDIHRMINNKVPLYGLGRTISDILQSTVGKTTKKNRLLYIEEVRYGATGKERSRYIGREIIVNNIL